MSATATKKGRKSKFRDYDDVIKHTEQPIAKRRELAIGRGGVGRKPRKFHLSEREIAQLTEEYNETGRFPNPQNRGMYWAIIEALIDMGADESHAQSRVLKRVEKLLSDESTKDADGNTAWDRFVNKAPRNAETGKDLEGRFEQNIAVLQRLTGLTPYGRKLLEVGQKIMGYKGAVIDILVTESTGNRQLRLNTKSDMPINETKVRGMGSPAALAAAQEAAKEERRAKRAAAKAAGETKPRKRKRKAKVEEPVAEVETPETVDETVETPETEAVESGELVEA